MLLGSFGMIVITKHKEIICFNISLSRLNLMSNVRECHHHFQRLSAKLYLTWVWGQYCGSIVIVGRPLKCTLNRVFYCTSAQIFRWWFGNYPIIKRSEQLNNFYSLLTNVIFIAIDIHYFVVGVVSALGVSCGKKRQKSKRK